MTEKADATAEREQLENAAKSVRSRLVADLDTLTDRRDRLAALLRSAKRQAREHRRLLLGVGIGAVVLAGTGMVIARVRARRDLRRHWLRALLAPWIAEQLRATAPSEGLVKKSLRRAGSELAAMAVAELGRQSLALLPPRDPERTVHTRGR
jgi:hypothetical protein